MLRAEAVIRKVYGLWSKASNQRLRVVDCASVKFKRDSGLSKFKF